jgi:hypothetical protein
VSIGNEIHTGEIKVRFPDRAVAIWPPRARSLLQDLQSVPGCEPSFLCVDSLASIDDYHSS